MQSLEKLLQLLEIEKQEDLKQYKNRMILTPLKERVRKGLTWYPIIVKHTEIGSGENFHLSIERGGHREENHAFQVGDSVSLFNNSNEHQKVPSISGVIASVWKDSMRIAFQVDELPEWVEYGSLGVDLLFDTITYQEMTEALKKVMEAKADRLAELRDVLIGGKKAARLSPEEIPEYYYLSELNASQNEAIQNILASRDIAIVHGPPGTGKTTTLVQAIKLTLEKEKQVLVCAPSNTAVDLLTERLLDKGLSVLRIGNPARVSQSLVEHSLEAQIAQHRDFHFLKKLRKEAEEYKRMAGKYKRKFGKTEREQRRLLYAEASRMLSEANILEKYIIDSLLNEAQVVTATLVGSVNKYIRFRRFSTVFIDEAAQALEPACWIPILKSERVVMAGDHQQLPPTVKSYEAARAGLSITLFEKITAQQSVDVMLRTQYRMHEQIMQFSNEQFYQGQLQADPSVKTHRLGQEAENQILNQALEFIDTAGCSFEEKINPETKSRYNPAEAELIAKHLSRLMSQIRMTNPQLLEQAFSVGVISPYNAQVYHLKDYLATFPELVEYEDWVRVNSIDGFQGQEREVIYISLVRSNEKGQIGFLADTRRMNVAMTRARKKLVVIGDSATLGQHPFYQDLIAYMENNQAYQSAWEYIS